MLWMKRRKEKLRIVKRESVNESARKDKARKTDNFHKFTRKWLNQRNNSKSIEKKNRKGILSWLLGFRAISSLGRKNGAINFSFCLANANRIVLHHRWSKKRLRSKIDLLITLFFLGVIIGSGEKKALNLENIIRVDLQFCEK